MDLSKRLQTVADAVTPGNRLADIGTDHAYVPIALVGAGTCPSAIASDVNKGPLERAAHHIEKAGLSDRIETRLGSGLDPVAPEEIDTAVFAGMGGDLMSKLLAAHPEFLQAGIELVLQPQSEWEKVRRLLHEQAYRIDREWFIKEDGKYYLVIRALPGEEKFAADTDLESYYCYGRYLVEHKDPLYRSYLAGKRAKDKGILLKLHMMIGDLSGWERRKERADALKKEIRVLEKLLKTMEE